MKYYELNFEITPASEDFADILSALLADEGFETFENTEKGLKAYVQQNLFSEESLKETLYAFPVPGVEITYDKQDAPNEDWNEQWEQEGFQPIILDNLLAVHDVRHTDIPKVMYDIRIHPRQAFGTGSHETTRMILQQLAKMDLTGKHVVDAGTGTGILAIMALMRGAKSVFAYDIDEWSVENAKDNLALNGKEAVVELGDSSVLSHTSDADLLIANINRNILLNDLPTFVKTLRHKGQVLLSGFYQQDVPMLEEKANELGMSKIEEQHDGEWTMLLFETDAAGRMDV